MYIWPFGRPAQSSVTSTRTQQTTVYSGDSKMEKEKGYLPRPVAAPRTASYRSRGFRPSRRFIAVALIVMIMFWNIQPIFKVGHLPPRTLEEARCRLNFPAGTRICPHIAWDEQTMGPQSFHDHCFDPCVSKDTSQATPKPLAETLDSHPSKSIAQNAIAENKDLVPLEAHIMSKCPDAQDCLVDLIIPAMQRVSDKVNFTLSFIGDIAEDETVHCKHGEDECLGNMMMLCAAKIYPDPKINLGFSTCLIKDYPEIPSRTLVEGCALEHAVDFDKLNSCMSEEGEGLELLKASIRRSAEKKVQLSCTVRLNDKLRCIRDGGEWVNCDDGSEPGDLIRDIDALYK